MLQLRLLFKSKEIIFCYIHLAAECDCNDDVVATKVATKVAGVDALLGIYVTAPLAFTVIVFHTSGRLGVHKSSAVVTS